MSEPFWLEDPSVLFKETNWYKFVPTGFMPVSESLNAIVRFAVYLSILLMAAHMKVKYVLIAPVIMLLTAGLFVLFPNGRVMEGFVTGYTGTGKTRPTPDNPFMNATLPEILDNPNKPPADDVTAKDVRDEVNAAFSKTADIYMDTTDVFDLVQSQRNFHTVPEDDQEGLLRFLGKNAKSSKVLNEGYVPAKGTISSPPPSTGIERPTGTSSSSLL